MSVCHPLHDSSNRNGFIVPSSVLTPSRSSRAFLTLFLLIVLFLVTGAARGDVEIEPVAIPAPSALAIRYHQTGNWFWGISQAWTLLVQIGLLWTGRSAWLRDVARRLGRFWFLTVGLYTVFYLLVVFVVDLPLSYYLGYVRQHAYGLSNQSLDRWLGNHFKELAVEGVGGFLFVWVPYWLLNRSPRRWWLITTFLSVPFSFFVMLIAPIWVDPLFNDFGPMKDRGLERRVLDLAAQAGISGSRVFEVNKSVDTRALNAYVKGFLDTKRIVLYDTLIEKLDGGEVLAVMGHEMGHYVLGHVTRSILLGGFVVLISLAFVDRAGGWAIRRFGARFKFNALGDVASVPLILLLLQIASLGLSPVVMAYSRYQEHEADRFALELTRSNHSAAKAFAELQRENLGVPWHSTFEKLWRSTHPSIGERITFCNTYHPWQDGKPLTYAHFFVPVPKPVGND